MSPARTAVARVLGIVSALSILFVLICDLIVIPQVFNWILGMNGPALVGDDPEVGLLPNPNVREERRVRERGKERRLDIETGEFGFTCAGRLDLPNRVLIIGDSFTAGWQVDHEETYANVLAAALESPIFAFGCDGYGTYNEWRILERHVDRIKPCLVVLQMCVNDAVDNCMELADHSFYERAGADYGLIFRPRSLGKPFFTETERAVFHRPGQGWLCDLPRYCPLRTVSLACVLLDHWVTLPPEATAEQAGGGSPALAEDRAKSGRITAMLLKRMKARCGPVPLVAFIAGNGQPLFRVLLENALQEAGIPDLKAVNETLTSKQEAGEAVVGFDGFHWNATGHRVCAEALKTEIPKYISPGH